MKKFLFSFVILHYNVQKETLACIESIKNRVHDANYHIVVVDNASPNKSGVFLKNLFKNDKLVTVLLNEKNLGFAKGNNVGIYYSKDVLKADFLIVLNNDTFLVQDNFVQVIESEWERSGFAVLGPHVDTYVGVNQNPVPYSITKKSEIWLSTYYCYAGLVRSFLGIDRIWGNFKKKVKLLVRRNEPLVLPDVRREMVKLHGCCWVFSPAFFEIFKGLDDRTFMYLEEDILWNHILQSKLLSVYNPELKIFHAEDAATNSEKKTWRKKQIFFHKEHLKSIKVLKLVLQGQ